jgi:hypothetical protein
MNYKKKVNELLISLINQELLGVGNTESLINTNRAMIHSYVYRIEF